MDLDSHVQVDAEPDDEDENEIQLDEEDSGEEGNARAGGQGRKAVGKKLTKDRNRSVGCHTISIMGKC